MSGLNIPWGGGFAAAAALSACLAASFPGTPAQAQIPSWARAWPWISTSVRVTNGWIVAQGMTTVGTANQVIWQVPLARAGAPVSIQHGPSTTYVVVGQRQFLIHDLTGAAYELRNGRFYRLTPVGAPGARAAPAAPRTRTVTPTALVPPGPPPSAPVQPSGPAAPVNVKGPGEPQQKAALEYNKAMQEAIQANDEFLQASQRLDTVRRMQADHKASPSDVRMARDAVDIARQQVRKARQQADALGRTVSASPSRAGTSALPGLSPQQRQDIQNAERRMVMLAELLNKQQMELRRLHESKAEPGELSAAQKRADQYGSQLELASLQHQQLRLAYSVPDDLDVATRARLDRAQRTVIALTAQVRRAEQQLRDVRDAQGSGAAGDGDVQEVISHLAAAMEKLDSAQRQLSSLHGAAMAQAQTKPASQ